VRPRGPDAPLEDAIAAVTCWIDGDLRRGRAIAAEAVDRDPVAIIDGFAGLWAVVADVCAEQDVDVQRIVCDIALGVASADVEEEP
jgi:hypothetical protein